MQRINRRILVILLNPQWIIYDPQVSIWITRGITLYIFLSALIGIISLMSHVLVAVAWPYANGPRHIGHVAGFGVPSDVYARYERMKGNDVLMVSGTDEHGTPILVQAEAEGVSPQELADRYNRVIAQDLCDLGLSYDLFTRTTTKNHEKVVQSMFTQCLKNGYIYKGTQMVAISPSSGRTLPDRYIEGTCPICGYDGARGDQCDNCGNELDPVDLIDPRSKINGEIPRFEETEHYFLDLPALAEANLAWLKTRKGWRTNVINFSIGLFDEVKPRAITRDIDWGIPVPVDGWIDNPNKKLYVWFDAVIGYLSASIEWARRKGDPGLWREWWNNADSPAYYFLGKDNITFHSQIWPSEILGYNGEGSKGGSRGDMGKLNMPSEVVASEFLSMEGKKFSSSRGIVIYVRDILSRYQVDALRYYISAIIMKSLCPAGAIWSTVLQFCFIRILAGSPISTHRICAISIPGYCILLQTALRQSAGCWIASTRKQRSPKPCVLSERSIDISQQQNHGKSRMTRRVSQLSCILLHRLLWMPIPFLHRSSRILRRKSMRLWADQARSLPCRTLKRCLTWMIPVSLIL